MPIYKKVIQKLKSLQGTISGRGDTDEKEIQLIPEKLASMAEKIVSKSRESEKDFSKLGNGLFGMHDEISGLLSLINETAESISSGDNKGLLADAEKVASKAISDIGKYKDLATESSGIIRAVSLNLETLFKICSSFEKVAFFFSSIGINIRIESRRTNSANEMFGFLSEEIKPISDKILRILNRIQSDIESVQKVQKDASEKISKGLEEYDRLAGNATTAVKDAIRDMDRIMGHSKKILDQAGDNSRKISAGTAEVVMQIQFHDSMRQRIEHMAYALNDAEKKMREGLAEPFNSGPGDEKLHSAYIIMKLQHAQLKAMSQEIEGIFLKTENAFSEIQGNIANLSESLSLMGKDDSEDSFTRLKDSFSDLRLIADKTESMAVNIRDATMNASSAAARLNEYMKEVERINSEIHLIALNAIIKAAHLGSEGMALEELAQTLVRLSKETGQIVSSVNQIIVETSKLIDKSGVTENKIRKETSVVFFEKTSDMISKAYDSFRQNASLTGSKAEKLRTTISFIIKDLEFMQNLAKDFENICANLGQDIETLKGWEHGSEASITEDASDLAKLYTMDRQREIHQSMLAENGSVTETIPEEKKIDSFGDIELFDPDFEFDQDDSRIKDEKKDHILIETEENHDVANKEASEHIKSKKDAQDFGDNVELF